MQDIMMPVRAINRGCLHCPELDIRKETTDISAAGAIAYSNYLYCSHAKKCDRLRNGLFKQMRNGERARNEETQDTDA